MKTTFQILPQGPSERNEAQPKSVVLLSGGLDSAANLAICRTKGNPILALTIDYGQRAAQAEIEAARKLCHFYQVPHQVIEAKWLGSLGKSALTEHEIGVPQVSFSDLEDVGAMAKTKAVVWVPNRNGVFIHIAAAYAESHGAEQVLVGFNEEEAATFPDNSIAYLNRVSAALELSTSNHVQVFSYTAKWNKKRIVSELRLLSVPFPFEFVWSCYHGYAEGVSKPCRKCESCQRLLRALA